MLMLGAAVIATAPFAVVIVLTRVRKESLSWI
jgi:hypothetical protein